jgi:hypothetical protein
MSGFYHSTECKQPNVCPGLTLSLKEETMGGLETPLGKEDD